jgi:adenylate kinase
MKKIILLFVLIAFVITGITFYKNSKKEKLKVIIVMGAPGAGKGTLCSELSKTLDLPHISTGDLFRENIKNQTKLGTIAKELLDKGQLAPDNLVSDMLFDHINSKGYDKTGYILDGFPRTLNQAHILDQKLTKNYEKIVFNLNINEEELIERITNRLVCPSCNTLYHKITFPPKVEGKCDNCLSDLFQRKDDTEEVLKNRLEIYNKETKPILDSYEKRNELHNIDSNNFKEVFENTLKIIEQF